MDINRTLATMAAPIYAAKLAAVDNDGVTRVILMRDAIYEAWQLWQLTQEFRPPHQTPR